MNLYKNLDELVANMLSDQAKKLFDEIRRTNSADEPFDLAEERRNSGQAGVLTGDPDGVDFATTRIVSLETIIARPVLRDPRRVMIFLHGGGFAMMSPQTHRRFAGHIANACRADVYIPEYSLAPEFPFPRALEECVRFTRYFTETGLVDDTRVVLSGDSAGGGLALSTAMKMRDEGAHLPACLVLLCPWLDLALTSQSVSDNRELALILNKNKLEAVAALYLDGEIDNTDPYISPVYGSLKGLPPIYLQGAELDLLVGDAARLQQQARADEAVLRYDLFPQMPHSFQFFAGAVPEADAAISQIGLFLDNTLGIG